MLGTSTQGSAGLILTIDIDSRFGHQGCLEIKQTIEVMMDCCASIPVIV